MVTSSIPVLLIQLIMLHNEFDLMEMYSLVIISEYSLQYGGLSNYCLHRITYLTLSSSLVDLGDVVLLENMWY